MQLESKTRFYLHDFITPLQSLAKKTGMTSQAMFDIFANKPKGVSGEKPTMRIQDFK